MPIDMDSEVVVDGVVPWLHTLIVAARSPFGAIDAGAVIDFTMRSGFHPIPIRPAERVLLFSFVSVTWLVGSAGSVRWSAGPGWPAAARSPASGSPFRC